MIGAAPYYFVVVFLELIYKFKARGYQNNPLHLAFEFIVSNFVAVDDIIGTLDFRKLYPSTKRTTALAVGELVLWYGMFAPAGRNDGTTGLPRGAKPIVVIGLYRAVHMVLSERLTTI